MVIVFSKAHPLPNFIILIHSPSFSPAKGCSNFMRMADKILDSMTTDIRESSVVKDDHAFTEPALGIDFGTYQCSVAVWNGSYVEILKGPQNQKLLRSYVMFDHEFSSKNATNKLGHDENEIFSGRAVFNMKRLIGRMDIDPVVHSSKNVPFLVQTLDIGVRPFIAALVNDAWRFTLVDDVLAIYFVQLRVMAEAYLKREVRNVVITIPASFSRFQQTLVEKACTRANLHVLRFMAEPAAVALTYAQQEQQDRDVSDGELEKIALVFNIGAGYCDVALTTTSGGVSHIQAMSGAAIGGEDLLQNTMSHLMPNYYILCDSTQSLCLLRIATQDAIHKLSSCDSVQIHVDLMNETKISRILTRNEFEEVNEDIFVKCGKLVTQCLHDAKMGVEFLDDVVLEGGCSNIPKIRSLVLGLCKKNAPYEKVNVLEAVVHGVALEGAIACGISHPMGNLDLLTIQTTPFRIGIRVNNENFVTIIQKNTVIPSRKSMLFTTANDDQTEALIIVYEGEERRVAGNQLLGFFKVSGIPLGPKGSYEINVCMDIDASNVLRVVAGVIDPRSKEPISPFIEVKMPTLDDGHRWCLEALDKTYGSDLNLEVVQKK